jgi:hypothetical protein
MSTVETSRIWSDGRYPLQQHHGSKRPCAREMLEDLKSTLMYIHDGNQGVWVCGRGPPCGSFGKRSEPMRHTRPQHQTLIKTQAGGHTLIVDDTQRSGANTGGIYYRDRYTFFPLRADELCFFSEEGWGRWEEQFGLFIRLCWRWTPQLRQDGLTRWPGWGFEIPLIGYVDRDVHTDTPNGGWNGCMPFGHHANHTSRDKKRGE